MIFSTTICAEGAEKFLILDLDLLVDANDEYSKRKRLSTKAHFLGFLGQIFMF